jgi:hypothetical protein
MSDETETPAVAEEAVAPAAQEAEPGAGEAEPQAKAAEKKPKKAKPAAKAKSKPAAKAKSKGKGKGKGKKGAGDGLSIASNPRATAQVRRAKGWGGLFGFGLALYISWQAGVPPAQAGLRALAAGIAGYMLAWACMVTIWRQLLVAEVRTLAERRQPPGAVPSGAAPGPTDDAGATKLPE